MVTLNDDHDHGDGSLCPGCRFREKLTELLSGGADGGGGDQWVHTVTSLIGFANDAHEALTRLLDSQYERPSDTPQDIANQAATAVGRLGRALGDLWNVLMDDDELEDDDPGAAL